MSVDVSYDKSLPIFAGIILQLAGRSLLDSGYFIRDALGRLSFISSERIDGLLSERLVDAVVAALGRYVERTQMPVASADEAGELKMDPEAVYAWLLLSDRSEPIRVNLVDRRLIGHDWSTKPSPSWRHGSPARFAFWSLKGGVGRTTALIVTAVHLARLGRHVLIVDMDLEAPGLGPTLLLPEELPKFGTLDWFVETVVRGRDALKVTDLIATVVVEGAIGTLSVVPALGRIAESHPENTISKLGRAYLEDVDENGQTSFLEKTAIFADWLLKSNGFDTLLLDVRAGLNEATPAALLGVGADILMFGTNSSQTFQGYRCFLSHLKGFPVDGVDDWRRRLKMVNAKATTAASRSAFAEKSYDLFRDTLYDDEIDPTEDQFSFNVGDPNAPHAPLVVLEDERFREFDPRKEQDQLTADFINVTFGDLLRGIEGWLRSE